MTSTRVVSGAFGTYVLVGDPVFSGGSASLFEIQGSPHLLYKDFSTPLNGKHVQRVTELVEVGRKVLEHNDLRGDVRRITWPLDLVVDRGVVCGVVIPRAGKDYFRPGTTVPVAQNFGHLAGPKAPPAKQRLFVIRQLAGTLAVLDRQKLVHGDISGSNMLWTLKPHPSLLLIDCDGIHPRGFETEPFCTRHWTDPRLDGKLIARHDAQSDWYALALAVYRVLVLDARALPAPSDFARIRRDTPSPIADLVTQVFADPRDGAARVRPDRWKQELRAVIEDADQCAQIDAATSGRPSTVAGRRAARAGAPKPRPPRRGPSKPPSNAQTPPVSPPPFAWPRPDDPSPGPSPSARNTSRPSRARRTGRRMIGWAAAAAVAMFALHYVSGLPDWPIMDRLNPLLSSEQRDLVAALPSRIRRCHAEKLDLPAGSVAAVRCRWNGRDVVALQFADRDALHAYSQHRHGIARRRMADTERPSPCPVSGVWNLGADPKIRGEATSFIASAGARVDWSHYDALTYLIGVSDDSDLERLCGWWHTLEYP